MNLREKRKALVAEVRGLLEKSQSENRDFTAEEAERVEAVKAEVADLDSRIAAADQAKASVDALLADDREHEITIEDQTGGQKGIEVHDRPKRQDSIGDAFVKSDAYKAFQKAFPSGAGKGSNISVPRVNVGSMNDAVFGRRKADLLTSQIAHPQPIRMPTQDMIDRPQLTLLDIISRGEMAGAFEYVQIVDVARRAGIVPEATGAVDADGNDADPLKPISTFSTRLADAKPHTFADGFEVTNQLLSDAPAFASWMNTELRYSLDNVIEDKLLNGTGEDGEPRGILHTSGIQHQPFVDDMVTSIRKGITRVTRVGGSVTAVLMSPEADEEWDLLKDANGRYFGQGPFGSGPNTAWGRPRIVSERLSGTNTVILGDFRTVALLDREGLSIEAFNQHKDFAQRNKVYVRAELRAGQVIWRPNRLVKVDLSSSASS